MLDTIIFIDVNIVKVMRSNLRRDNVVGFKEDITRGAEESSINQIFMHSSEAETKFCR
jgi:hypothetical protein